MKAIQFDFLGQCFCDVLMELLISKNQERMRCLE